MTEMKFFVSRRTGSVSDVLEAIGAAFLVQRTAGLAPEEIRIEQSDAAFEIRSPDLKQPRTGVDPLIPYFKDKDSDGKKPNRGEVYDYATDKKRSEERRAATASGKRSRSGTRGRRAAAIATEEHEDRGTPSHRWPTFNALQSLTKGGFKKDWNGTFDLLDGVDARGSMDLAAGAWSALSTQNGEPAVLTNPLNDEITLVQYLNPIAAKGTNRAKADSVRRDNLKGPRFVEWLKMIAFDRSAILGRVGDDIRLWVPIPADVSLDALVAASTTMADRWRPGNIGQDIATTIDFAEALARHWLERKTPPRRRANRVVRGLDTVTFQDMGGGFNVMNVTTYGLPGWIELRDETALESYLQALDAFRSAARSLDESHSDEVPVLIALRDALGAEEDAPILEFFGEYATAVQRRMGRSEYAYRFTTSVIDTVIGGLNEMLTEIVHDEGFRNIATAIRKATVTEQYWKSKKQQVYDIHYGLFADLRRALRRKPDLVARLADFISKYNAENARIIEASRDRGRPRARVSDADLDAVMALIQTHGSEIVGSLLCAYGSATSPQDDDTP